MSDTFLRFVSAVPTFVPSASAAAQAEALLRRQLRAEAYLWRISDHVTFVDAGSNWERVFCPSCGADAEPWWADAMSGAAEQRFQSLQVFARCCGSLVSLNELRYGWPVAFGRFVLEATNPLGRGLSSQQIEELGAVLGCPVRQVHAHV
jgi:hypothetical protein